MTIYLDMDGVLANFDGGLAQYGIVNDVWFIHKDKSQWTPEQIELDKKVVQVMKIPGYFRNLKLLDGAFDLYNSVRHLNPWILTARPNEKVSADRVTKEKKDWINEHLGQEQLSRTIVCLRAEKAQYALCTDINSHNGHPWTQDTIEGADQVSGHKDKRQWVTTPNILVDDLKANCSAWEQAGGVSVWHQGDFVETIKKLEQVING